ncbi:MAG: DMT family transporter [Gammaproteobacteria bacterium]|nr:DMT family transporter [Gammaproteobacteria bacterium]
MELWIPLTVAAAFFQNIRSAMQKHLKGRLSTLGAAYVRFLYAMPFAFIYLLGLQSYGGDSLPPLNSEFLIFSLLGGICQILFTVFLLWLFSFHNFAVGTTMSKLETIMVAIFGLLLLGDHLTPPVILAIVLSSIGLIVLSAGQSKLKLSSLCKFPTLIGLACAAWLGLSVVFFRAASLSLNLDNYLLAASFTLFIVLILQTVIMGTGLLLKDRSELVRVFTCWRPAIMVGLFGALTSIGWFTAFTLQNATYVRALGQIELVFTFIATLFFFREKITAREYAGVALIIGSIVLVLLG